MKHHDIFYKFKCWSGRCVPSSAVNFLGVVTRKEHMYFDSPIEPLDDNISQASGTDVINTEYPRIGEDYFEMIDVLETVTQAKDGYTIMELGAGFGPHLVNAACAARLHHGSNFPCTLIGVEAEPTCFRWMQEHFRDNGIDPAGHQLFEAAIIDRDGKTKFQVGFPDGFGGFIVSPLQRISNPARWLYRRLKKAYNKLTKSSSANEDFWSIEKKRDEMHPEKVRAISLGTLLRDLNLVDLMHLDILGKECIVLMSAREEVDKKVKRVHIGTHGAKVEEELRNFFHNLGWECLYDFSGATKHSTPYGKMECVDGVQTWVNPRLS